MHSGKLTEPYIFACGVTLVPKSKRCGKANCSDCPHGPYWYARAPHTATMGRARLDLYLGSSWNHDDLLGKVAPLLVKDVRAELEQAIRDVLAGEMLVTYEARVKSVKQQIEQEHARHKQHLGEYNRQLAMLSVQLDSIKVTVRDAARRQKAKAHA